MYSREASVLSPLRQLVHTVGADSLSLFRAQENKAAMCESRELVLSSALSLLTCDGIFNHVESCSA